MKPSKSVEYIKVILDELTISLSLETLQKLYQDHIQETAQRNLLLQQITRDVNQSSVSYHIPAQTLERFKVQYLPSVLLLQFLNSNLRYHLTELHYHEIAYLLGTTTSINDIITLERQLVRYLKSPRTRETIYQLKQTYAEITFPKENNLSSF